MRIAYRKVKLLVKRILIKNTDMVGNLLFECVHVSILDFLRQQMVWLRII